MDTPAARKAVLPFAFSALFVLSPASDYVLGCLVGWIDLLACVESSRSTWFGSPFGFVLKNQKVYSRPLSMLGTMGFFSIDPARVRSME